MNIVILMGNITRDPEMKHTGSNNAVANFSVAVNEKWTDKSGEKKERVAFIDCEAWVSPGWIDHLLTFPPPARSRQCA